MKKYIRKKIESGEMIIFLSSAESTTHIASSDVEPNVHKAKSKRTIHSMSHQPTRTLDITTMSCCDAIQVMLLSLKLKNVFELLRLFGSADT